MKHNHSGEKGRTDEIPAELIKQQSLGKLISDSMVANRVRTIPDMPEDVLLLLKADGYNPNSIPVYTMRNMLRLLAIDVNAAIKAMNLTLEMYLKKKESGELEKSHPWAVLWENPEALTKYTDRLKELMPEQSRSPASIPMTWRKASREKDLPHNFDLKVIAKATPSSGFMRLMQLSRLEIVWYIDQGWKVVWLDETPSGQQYRGQLPAASYLPEQVKHDLIEYCGEIGITSVGALLIAEWFENRKLGV